MAASTLIHITDCIPFSAAFYRELELTGYPLDGMAKISRRYELSYLSWELVRRNRNPFFNRGTGFEGYFVGVCQSTDEVLDRIIPMGQDILASISRRFRTNYGFKSLLMKTLSDEIFDSRCIAVWSSLLGAAVARLRCNLHHNLAGDIFRIDTYRIVNSLPQIRYYEKQQMIQHEYWLGYQRPNLNPIFDIQTLKPCDRDAALVAWSIGRFGHPLLRSYLHQTGCNFF